MKRNSLLLLFIIICFWAYPAVVPVEPGTQTIYNAVANANVGDVLELTDGVYNETNTVIIDKALEIRAASGKNPTINAKRFTVRSHFILDGVTFDGNLTNTEAIRIDEGQNLVVKILNSNIQNFTSRGINLYATSSEVMYVDSLIVDGCMFKNVLRVINAASAPTQVKSISIKNSTFDKINQDGYFIYIYASATTDLVKVVIDQCTFYNCFSRRGVYLANIDYAIVKNCIASFSETVSDTKSFSVYGNNSILKNTISYNVEPYGGAPRNNIITTNPLFVDPENGNFQLYANSPAIGAGDTGGNLGDLRWGVSTEDAPMGDLPYVPFKKPYTTTPTENSIRVMWQMPDTTSTGVVYYGKTEALGDSVVSNGGWLVEGEGFVHVKEINGLEPYTTYYYMVGDGRRKFEEIQSTKTAPSEGTGFRLVLVSDIHENSGQIWQNMVSPILQQKPDLLMHLGDIINTGDTRPWNSSFFTPSEPLLKEVPVNGAVGNHETGDKSAGGPTTYFDYFSSPSHGYIDGSDSIDPRGESYYSMDYGDAKIISLNLNGDDFSPSFVHDSQQMTWLDNQLENSTSKWIFIFAHVSVYSTGYHGQWSGNLKTYVAPVLEEHAQNGKFIIFFSGNCHSFEHLYKSGVHHVRPSVCASNTRDQYNLADLPYSLFWKKTNGFSTIDMSPDGEKVTLTGRDETGEEFYVYEFTRTSQMLPSLYFTEPNGIDDIATDSYRIKWTCFDEGGNGKISLYHSLDSINGTLIADSISTDTQLIDYYDWNVRYLEPKGDYYIYGILDDGVNPAIKRYARGKVTVVKDTIAPPAPTNFSGNVAGNQIVLTWQNPTRLVDVVNAVDDFENGIDQFVGVPHNQTATGSLELADGYNSVNALKINYNITVAWGQYSAVLQYDQVQNFSTTPYLEFWYKGDGSSRYLRLIIKQDLDFNGVADDWWYNETLLLNSTEWQKVKLDVRTFQELSWHPNISDAMDPNNIFALEFIIPSSTIGGGFVVLDDINFTGQVYPAEDFEGVKILRRTDRYPGNHTDGDVIYNGVAETYTDLDVTTGNTYYYAGFTYDDLGNYSEFSQDAAWQNLPTNLDDKFIDKSLLVYPNPVKSFVNIKFTSLSIGNTSVHLENISGSKVMDLVTNLTAGGTYEVSLDVKDIPAGVYFIRMISNGTSVSKKIIINE
ncbi:MAG TPA: metallophosphoesterase [Paludibacter sp.]|nr:metallophosphoesterase [Paludibacter sp.]HOS45250.1 metallophosphoesterase [Paludibacter sp.]